MLSRDRLHYLLQLLNYFQGHWEDPEWEKHPLQQQLLLLALHELGSVVEDELIRSTIQDITSQAVQELSRIYMKKGDTLPPLSSTPLTDFLARFADPKFLDKYNQNPQEVLGASGLSEEYRSLLQNGDRGLLRMRATQELEKAGLAPMITDKINIEDLGTTPFMNYNTNNWNTNSITINTTVNSIYNGLVAISENIMRSNWFNQAMESVNMAISHFAKPNYEKQGRLTIVGSGIKAISDFTLGALAEIRAADKVLYCVADPVTERYPQIKCNRRVLVWHVWKR